MCRMCEGFSMDDVIALAAARVAEYGFGVQAVAGGDDPDRDPFSWAYTIGLLDGAGHPELVVAGVPRLTSGPVLSAIAEAVLAGGRFDVGDEIELGDDGIAVVGAVHPVQYDLSTFAMWHNLRGAGSITTSTLEAVQIILPAELCPFRDESWQPVLADADARVGAAH